MSWAKYTQLIDFQPIITPKNNCKKAWLFQVYYLSLWSKIEKHKLLFILKTP